MNINDHLKISKYCKLNKTGKNLYLKSSSALLSVSFCWLSCWNDKEIKSEELLCKNTAIKQICNDADYYEENHVADHFIFRKKQVCWLVVGVLWHINLCKLFNAKSIFMQIVLFQTIQFSMSTQFNCQKHFYFNLFSLVQVQILFTHS